MSFRGTFDLTLDAKSRLTVPARYRGAFPEGRIVVAVSLDQCLGLWRPDDYAAWTSESLAGHSLLSPQRRDLSRFYTSNSVDSELDAAGRVIVPRHLLAMRELGKELTVIGTETCLEIWDRALWASHSKELAANALRLASGLEAKREA